MNFEGFSRADFPAQEGSLPGPPKGFEYVFFWAADGLEHPFYVGQTMRLSGRMRDYELANSKATADFRVGHAVKYLQEEKKLHVLVKYKESQEPLKEEHAIIRELLLEGVRLLNSVPAYDYLNPDGTEPRDSSGKSPPAIALSGFRRAERRN